MFGLSFYVICWLLFLLLCLPIIFAGLLAIALEIESAVVTESRLKGISREFNKYVNDNTKLRVLLEEFMRSLKNYPKAGDECNLWLDLISRFAANMNLMEVEEVVNFQNSLESANPNEKASIKEAIGKALQKRQGN